jgi:hypothetical protein
MISIEYCNIFACFDKQADAKEYIKNYWEQSRLEYP